MEAFTSANQEPSATGLSREGFEASYEANTTSRPLGDIDAEPTVSFTLI
jgi:hypothetical protein